MEGIRLQEGVEGSHVWEAVEVYSRLEGRLQGHWLEVGGEVTWAERGAPKWEGLGGGAHWTRGQEVTEVGWGKGEGVTGTGGGGSNLSYTGGPVHRPGSGERPEEPTRVLPGALGGRAFF